MEITPCGILRIRKNREGRAEMGNKKNLTLRVDEKVIQYLKNREINISDWFEHMVRSLMMNQDFYAVIPNVGKKVKYEWVKKTSRKDGGKS